MCIEVCIPLIKPRPVGINHAISILITITVRVINVKTVHLVVRNAFACMRETWCCMLVEVSIPLHKLV